MPFKNEYVPPRDMRGASEFIHQTLAESRAKNEKRRFPHPFEHYSAHNHVMTEFVKVARDALRTGHSVWDMWTIDHEREMVLIQRGWAREGEDYCSWEFIDRKGRYRFGTTRLSRAEIAPGELAVAYQIDLFWGSGLGHGHSIPDNKSLVNIKEAISEHHRHSLFNFDAYEKREVTLIDGRSNTEI